MVSLTDGMYVSHGFTEMLALQGFEESDCTVLLRGHAGELAKASTAWPLHTDARIFAMSSTEEFIPYLLARLTHVSRGDAAREVFTDRWIEALDGAERAALARAIAGRRAAVAAGSVQLPVPEGIPSPRHDAVARNLPQRRGRADAAGRRRIHPQPCCRVRRAGATAFGSTRR